MSYASAHAHSQYSATTGNLTARIALHSYGLGYLDGWAPLTPPEREAARARIQQRIDADGAFRIRKHTVLVTARAA